MKAKTILGKVEEVEDFAEQCRMERKPRKIDFSIEFDTEVGLRAALKDLHGDEGILLPVESDRTRYDGNGGVLYKIKFKREHKIKGRWAIL